MAVLMVVQQREITKCAFYSCPLGAGAVSAVADLRWSSSQMAISRSRANNIYSQGSSFAGPIAIHRIRPSTPRTHIHAANAQAASSTLRRMGRAGNTQLSATQYFGGHLGAEKSSALCQLDLAIATGISALGRCLTTSGEDISVGCDTGEYFGVCPVGSTR